ncbi:MAG: hypothetical protein KAU21_05950, partial [Gammaproteobacteria bacterium]|nr:hypothetical protein [Gammaproteobacteria bacterium]
MKTHKLSILLGVVLGTLVLTPVNAEPDKWNKELRKEQRRDEGKAKHKDKQQKKYNREQRKSPAVKNSSQPSQRKQNNKDQRQPEKKYSRGDHRSETYRTNTRPKSRYDSKYYRQPRHEHTESGYRKDRYKDRRHDYRDYYRDNRRYEYRHGRPLLILTPRHRTYRNVYIGRPYGHTYFGYGHFLNDNNALKWLTFTAITLKLLDMVDEQSQREHEAAQIAATTAEVGER